MEKFLSLYEKYGWPCLTFRSLTENGDKNILRKLDHISLADMKIQAWGYFGAQGVGNINTPIKYLLVYRSLGNIASKHKESDMI